VGSRGGLVLHGRLDPGPMEVEEFPVPRDSGARLSACVVEGHVVGPKYTFNETFLTWVCAIHATFTCLAHQDDLFTGTPVWLVHVALQGYLAHKKTPPPRTLQ